MHKVRTPWPVATRVQYIVAFQECQRRWGLSARRFCAVAEVPYPTFARWWALWRRQGKYALLDRPRRPRRSPGALPGQALDVIRRTHWELGWGVRRLHAHLRQAGLIRCSVSTVYRVLRRCGALVRRRRKPKRCGFARPRNGLVNGPRWTSSTCPRDVTSSPSLTTAAVCWRPPS